MENRDNIMTYMTHSCITKMFNMEVPPRTSNVSGKDMYKGKTILLMLNIFLSQ